MIGSYFTHPLDSVILQSFLEQRASLQPRHLPQGFSPRATESRERTGFGQSGELVVAQHASIGEVLDGTKRHPQSLFLDPAARFLAEAGDVLQTEAKRRG